MLVRTPNKRPTVFCPIPRSMYALTTLIRNSFVYLVIKNAPEKFGTMSNFSGALHKVLKRRHYPLEVMMLCVRWYVAYPLSFRHIEEIMEERSVVVDHD